MINYLQTEKLLDLSRYLKLNIIQIALYFDIRPGL